MYISSFGIQRIKCFDNIEVRFPHDKHDYGGWNVLLGGNGTGKSTFLQALALTLIGPLAGQRLLNPTGWVNAEETFGEFRAVITKGEQDLTTGQPRKKPYDVYFGVTGNSIFVNGDQIYDRPQLILLTDVKQVKALVQGPHAAKGTGWFCCGYGPFRRLSGGDSTDSTLTNSAGAEGRFATLFRESAALTMCQDWLTQLYGRSLDPSNPQRTQSKHVLETVRDVLDRLLPVGTHIEKIDTTMVYFRTAGEAVVPIPDLSDGFRSFLAFAIDILRHVVGSNLDLSSLVENTANGVRVHVEGIVLIDEVDAHLHPLWQRSIGFKLREVFPRIQFIVTTHSPFVAQAASDGGLFVLQPGKAGRVEVTTPIESVRGWRADQILTSPLFRLTGTRDEETELLIQEHAALVAKRQWNHMSGAEQAKLAGMEEKLSHRVTAPGDSIQEREKQEEMRSYVEKTIQRIGAGE